MLWSDETYTTEKRRNLTQTPDDGHRDSTSGRVFINLHFLKLSELVSATIRQPQLPMSYCTSADAFEIETAPPANKFFSLLLLLQSQIKRSQAQFATQSTSLTITSLVSLIWQHQTRRARLLLNSLLSDLLVSKSFMFSHNTEASVQLLFEYGTWTIPPCTIINLVLKVSLYLVAILWDHFLQCGVVFAQPG